MACFTLQSLIVFFFIYIYDIPDCTYVYSVQYRIFAGISHKMGSAEFFVQICWGHWYPSHLSRAYLCLFYIKASDLFYMKKIT